MTKETVQPLRELFANLDAIYGVHTRLYKLNHTIYNTALWNLRAAKNISSATLLNSKAAKINSVRTTGTIIASLSAIILVAIQVLPINLVTVPTIIVVGIIIFVFYLGCLSYGDASKTEKEFKELIETADKIEKEMTKEIFRAESVSGVESWTDYSYDQILHWQTLGVIAKDILKDITINPEIKKNYSDKLETCIKKLKSIKSSNEKLHRDGIRTKEDCEKINTKINDALQKLER